MGLYKAGDVVSILGDTNTGLIILKICDKVVYVGNYEIDNKDIELVPYIRHIKSLRIV